MCSRQCGHTSANLTIVSLKADVHALQLPGVHSELGECLLDDRRKDEQEGEHRHVEVHEYELGDLWSTIGDEITESYQREESGDRNAAPPFEVTMIYGVRSEHRRRDEKVRKDEIDAPESGPSKDDHLHD